MRFQFNIKLWNCVLALFLITTWLPAQEEEVDWQSETCMECHDDIPEMSHKTVHNPTFKVRCEDCHTNSAEHIDDPEPENIVTRGDALQRQCLNCHEQVSHTPGFRNRAHGGENALCGDCHQGHKSNTPPEHLLAVPATELCLTCHAEVQGDFAKPFAHNLSHEGVDCVSCHNIHPGKGLSGGFGLERTCVSCHQEKRGPFVFEHVNGSAGDCLSCHEAHGSSNPMQLTRATVRQLCLECHSSQSAPSFGSQPPAIHDMRSPRYRNCTGCHEAVHGSHSSPLLLK